MVNIIICDDEKEIAEKLKQILKQFFNKRKIAVSILEYTSGEELLRSKKEIDILFLDIKMQGIDGIETAKKLRKYHYKGFLIFITVLKEMVFKSFEVQPFDYLIKPINEEDLKKTMERLLYSIKTKKASLLIQRGYESNIISFQDIISCEVIDRKVYLHLESNEVIDYYDRIEHLEKKLDGRFFRCHRSYLINLNYLKSFKNNTAYMINGEQIPVSRLRSKEFAKVILQYMKEWRE